MRQANCRGAYIAENVEGFIQCYVQHPDSFGKKFVQMFPEVLKWQSKGSVSVPLVTQNTHQGQTGTFPKYAQPVTVDLPPTHIQAQAWIQSAVYLQHSCCAFS